MYKIIFCPASAWANEKRFPKTPAAANRRPKNHSPASLKKLADHPPETHIKYEEMSRFNDRGKKWA